MRHKLGLIWLLATLLTLVLLSPSLARQVQVENQRVDQHESPPASWRGNPRLALDGQGQGYAFWDDQRDWPVPKIYFNLWDREWGGAEVERELLGADGAVMGAVAADGVGNVYVTYADADNRPIFGQHQAGQAWDTWASPEDIRERTGYAQASLPRDIAVDEAGTVYMVLGPDDRGETIALLRQSADDWTYEQVAGEDANFNDGVEARLAAAADGVLYVAWGYRRINDGLNLVLLRRRGLDGAWAEPQQIGSESASYSLQGVDLAIDGAGNVYVAWSQCTGTQVCRVYLNRCPNGGCDPEAQELVDSSSGDRRFYAPRLVVTPGGIVYLICWEQDVSSGQRQLILFRRSLGGDWGQPESLDSTYNQVVEPDLALGGDYVGAVWSDEVGEYEFAIWSNLWRAGLLPGQWPDLAIGLGPDDVQVGQLYETEQGGNYAYALPLTFTVYNQGDGDVENASLELYHGLPGQPTTLVAELGVDVAAGYSTTLRYDWDVTDVMGRLDFVVALDPADQIDETSEINNQVSASTMADARPRLTSVRSSYKPGAFLEGVDLNNTFYVEVDWNGDLPGLGGADFVTFALNGSQTQVSAGDPGQVVPYTYNLGAALVPGLNRLRLSATNDRGLTSGVRTIELIGLETPQWLASSAVPQDEPPGARYDKAAVYRFDATWPDSTLDATLVSDLPVMSGALGPVLRPWSLDLVFRSDGRLGDFTGEGELLGYLAGQPLISDESAQVDVAGDVLLGGADSSYTLNLASLVGAIRAEGALRTNRLPLISSTLPFVAQSELSLAVDAQLVVTEDADGQLCWVTQTLPLDVNVEGVLSGGGMGLNHVDGGMGGQPWHRLGLAPGGSYTSTYAANLYAWVQDRFLVWDKTWEMTYTHAYSDHPTHAFSHKQSGPALAPFAPALERTGDVPNVVPDQTFIYGYADPALAYRDDADMTLVYVRRSGIAGLNLSAYRWTGSQWADAGLITHGSYVNAQPTVAYSGQTPVVLWTRVTTPVTDLTTDPRTVLPFTEIAATIYLGDQPRPPTADFYSSGTYVVGDPISFHNTTTPGVPPETSYQWRFGDGSPRSTLENPVHTYTSVGTYTVVLTASNATGGDTATDSIVVGCYPPTDADFGFSPSVPTVSDTVYFVGSVGSGSPTPTYTWYFSDTTPLVEVGNPVSYTYSQPNTYTVWMTASNLCGRDAISHSVYVTPPKPLLESGGEGGWSRLEPPAVDPPGPSPDPGFSLVGPGPERPQASRDWVTATLLTENGVMDFMPTAQADVTGSGRIMVMWLRDSDLNYPLFADEAGGSLSVDVWAAHWDGIAWTSPTLAISDVSTRQAPQFAYRDDRAFVVWSQDADGDQTTLDDTAVYYALCISPTWGALGTPLPGGDGGTGVVDLSPRVVYDRDGRATVVWLRYTPLGADTLYYGVYAEGAGWIIEATPAFETQAIDGLELVVGPDDTPIALWRARSDAGMDLWYSVYDQNKDRWSAPEQLTDDEVVEGGYDATVNSDSQAVVLYVGRRLEYAERTIEGQEIGYPVFGTDNQLYYITSSAANTRDLLVTDLVVSPGNPAPGSGVHVSATLVNAGSLTVDPAYLVFRDGNTDISLLYDAGPLAAGNRATFGFDWTVPLGNQEHTLSAIADPDDVIDESEEENNTISQTLVLPDLQVAWWASDYTSQTITVTVGVENGGMIAVPAPFALGLSAGSAVTVPYASAVIYDDLGAGETMSVTFGFDNVADLPPAAVTSYAVVDVNQQVTEFDEGNNAALLDVPLKPDLAVYPQDWVGTASRLLTVHNRGPIDADEVAIRLYLGDLTGPTVWQTQVSDLAAGEGRDVLVYGVMGNVTLSVHLDPDNAVVEGDESNNLLDEVSLWPRLYLPTVLKER